MTDQDHIEELTNLLHSREEEIKDLNSRLIKALGHVPGQQGNP